MLHKQKEAWQKQEVRRSVFPCRFGLLAGVHGGSSGGGAGGSALLLLCTHSKWSNGPNPDQDEWLIEA